MVENLSLMILHVCYVQLILMHKIIAALLGSTSVLAMMNLMNPTHYLRMTPIAIQMLAMFGAFQEITTEKNIHSVVSTRLE